MNTFELMKNSLADELEASARGVRSAEKLETACAVAEHALDEIQRFMEFFKDVRNK
jgi:hypothetical protein